VEAAREVVSAAESKGPIRFVGGVFGSWGSESCGRACGERSLDVDGLTSWLEIEDGCSEAELLLFAFLEKSELNRDNFDDLNLEGIIRGT
jgi:hypothetical protein